MTHALEHSPGEDFGTLNVDLDRDDDATFQYFNGRPTIRLPLYAHEARELIAILQTLADTPDAQ